MHIHIYIYIYVYIVNHVYLVNIFPLLYFPPLPPPLSPSISLTLNTSLVLVSSFSWVLSLFLSLSFWRGCTISLSFSLALVPCVSRPASLPHYFPLSLPPSLYFSSSNFLFRILTFSFLRPFSLSPPPPPFLFLSLSLSLSLSGAGARSHSPFLSLSCRACRARVCHDSYMCVPCLIHVCAMTHTCLCHDSYRRDSQQCKTGNTLQHTVTHCNALQVFGRARPLSLTTFLSPFPPLSTSLPLIFFFAF